MNKKPSVIALPGACEFMHGIIKFQESKGLETKVIESALSELSNLKETTTFSHLSKFAGQFVAIFINCTARRIEPQKRENQVLLLRDISKQIIAHF